MIKRTLLTVLATGLAFTATYGQALKDFEQEFAVGASFGVNFSDVRFMPKVYTGWLMGYNAGIMGRWNTHRNLGLQAELNFSQQGWEEVFENEPEYQYSRTINYIELPFLTHIYFGSNSFKFYVNMGPKIGYAIGESTSENLNGAAPNRANEQHDMPIEKKFDWGLCGGPGIEIRTKAGYFLLEGRFYYALGDIFNSRKDDDFWQSTSQVFSAKVTYVMPILKKK
ncbi:MAG: PorT family protein [Tannerellaceae bacterium]|nr:PorT family protein [Tannerellaceae bacterium]MCD8263100.1 PorT family protein [Tannerellaceae bacterium]